MKLATLALGALFLSGVAASAQTFSVRDVVDRLRSAGWTDISVERDDGRVEIEAERGRLDREWTYNARTGRLISVETDRDDDGDDDRRRDRRDRDDDRKGKKDRSDDRKDRKDRKDTRDRDDRDDDDGRDDDRDDD